MTYTRGSGYSFSAPDDGCCDTRNMLSNFAVNKCLHTVASSWTFLLTSLLQLVAASLKQVLMHPRGLTLFVRVIRNGDQKVQIERYQM